ncbi:MAG TPA: GNAT family N-acetyltransferase [Acidimicrobiia bacterium]|nr:GNAT family N-acetyltransferase [Acidimicrobiia bacterium]
MVDEITIRTIEDSEVAAFRDAMATVFAFDPKEEDLEIFRGWVELDRSMAAVDDGRIVATGGAVTFQMVVPGGSLVGAAGLTMITVQPTHRRRGLLRRMIERHFDDAAARGEPVSILWASESSIYGRFGYGVAVEARDLTIARSDGRLRSDVPGARGHVRLHDADEARPIVEKIYRMASVEAGIPGSLVRRNADWDGYFDDPEHRRKGATRLHFAIYHVEGEARGYVRYRLKSSWSAAGPDGTVMVHDLQALDGDAYAALWRYLFSIDLMVKIEVHNRRPAEAVYRLLADPRRVESAGYDAIWVRILDVPTALASRRYSVDGSLVFDVIDDMRPGSGGRFRLEGGPDGASCEPTDAAADIQVPVEHLGAAYLGVPHLAELRWLGMVEGDRNALRLADAMFRWSPPPHTSVHF